MRETSGMVAGVLRMGGEQGQASRVLVVRDGLLRDRVSAALEGARVHAEVEASPSYLSAMGWLARERVDVIIGPVSAMTGMVGSTARALRRLAPGTRLVVVAGADERAEAGAALSAGFDECVYEPADATTLLASLGLTERERADPIGGDASRESVEPDHTSTGQAEADASAEAVESAEASVQRQASDAMHKAALGPELMGFGLDEAERREVGGAVGDVDLAEAVIRGDGTLETLAERLLREQSGIADASFVPADRIDQATLGEAAVEVAYGGRVYGALTSASATRQRLGPWSAWLARWVALEHRQAELYRLAMRDELTGLWNRRYFDRFLKHLLRHAAQGRQQVTLLVFDIDNFKQYNDNYGHPAGDEILKSTAVLIQSLVREHDVVARIGGDEFACVFWDKGEPRHPGSQHPDSVIGIAKRFQRAICEHRFPKLGEEAVGRLTVSGGLAGFPWDGRAADELIEHADAMAIQSKRQGKNAICFGHGAAPNGNGEGGCG